MNKIVFKEFMRRDVVQKSIIFASAFGISITKWYGSKEDDKFPYRIYFYQGQNIVGYIDAIVEELGNNLYTSYHLPFEFFTPIGIMKGEFDSSNEIFCYDVEEKNNNFDKIDGIFSIKTSQDNANKNYIIGSYIKLESQNKPLLHISFNKTVCQAEFEIESRQHFCEEIKYWINSTPHFVHYNYLNRNQKEKLAEIIFTQSDISKVITAEYDFPTTGTYQDIITKPNSDNLYNPIWRMIRDVDLNSVWKELTENDPRLIEFINEVREEMIIYSKKSKPISLYDRMATLCFGSPEYKNSFSLVQAKRENMGLENNPVLRKMREYKR